MRELFFALGLLASTGCVGTEATVTGSVTLDGKPLERGGVTFTFIGDGPTAVGNIEAGGRYRLMVGTVNTLPPGRYLATVVSFGEVKEGKPGDTPAPPPVLTPLKYRDKDKSGLKFEVKPGSNVIDIPLTTK